MERKQVLSKEEALDLHHKTLVIDSQQPPATNGFLFNNNMKIKLNELEQKGYKRNQAAGILSSMAAMGQQRRVQLAGVRDPSLRQRRGEARAWVNPWCRHHEWRAGHGA